MKGMGRKREAFTLVELRIVVIIVVLIALLLPSLGRARDQAQTVACQLSLRPHAKSMPTNSADAYLRILSLEYIWTFTQ